VAGGFSAENYALDDIWTCEVKTDTDKNPVETKWEQATKLSGGKHEKLKLPRAGCMYSMVVTPKEDKRFKEARLWVYGGAEDPYSIKPFDKLWYIKQQQPHVYAEWSSLAFPAEGAAPSPLGAGLLYTGGTLKIAGHFELGAEDISKIFSLTGTAPLKWTPVDESWWETRQAQLLLIRSVSFRRYCICYPVFMYPQELNSKNPRIYREGAHEG
jgi:hypothetical protein